MQVIVFPTYHQGKSYNLELWTVAELEYKDTRWRLLGHPASPHGVYYRNGKSKSKEKYNVHQHLQQMLVDLLDREIVVDRLALDDDAFQEAVKARHKLTILNPEDNPLQPPPSSGDK